MKKLLNRLFSRMVITCLLVAAQLIFFMVEVLKLQQYYVLVAAILHLLSFIAVMHLLLKDVNPSIKLAWIVPILMFPEPPVRQAPVRSCMCLLCCRFLLQSS